MKVRVLGGHFRARALYPSRQFADDARPQDARHQPNTSTSGVLVFDQFTAAGASLAQVRDIFKASRFRIFSLSEISRKRRHTPDRKQIRGPPLSPSPPHRAAARWLLGPEGLGEAFRAAIGKGQPAIQF